MLTAPVQLAENVFDCTDASTAPYNSMPVGHSSIEAYKAYRPALLEALKQHCPSFAELLLLYGEEPRNPEVSPIDPGYVMFDDGTASHRDAWPTPPIAVIAIASASAHNLTAFFLAHIPPVPVHLYRENPQQYTQTSAWSEAIAMAAKISPLRRLRHFDQHAPAGKVTNGSSISANNSFTSGSVTCGLTFTSHPNRRFVLTCAHVLDGQDQPNSPALSPLSMMALSALR